MVPFNLELEFADGDLVGTAEQLDQLADTAGFMRYQITAAKRRAIIFVNIEGEPQRPVTAQDAENYYEASHYPEQVLGYSEDEVFTLEEVNAIAAAISTYNNGRKLKFDQMNFDF